MMEKNCIIKNLIHNLYFSLNIIKVMKIMKSAEHVKYTGRKNAFRI